MPIPPGIALFVSHDWVITRRVPTNALGLLLLILIAIALNPRQVAAQSDPRSPTDPSDPLKLLVRKLNDPQLGAALRAQWYVDRQRRSSLESAWTPDLRTPQPDNR